MEKSKKDLWKDAQGDDLPEFDREVVVIQKTNRVSFGHRPDPNGWDGKNVITGKVTHYDPMTYGKGGWNIDDVKYWLDAQLPWDEEDGEEEE